MRCEEPQDPAIGWMDRGRVCSLERGHEGIHVAYWGHNVTGNGADVCWLGPWADGRPYSNDPEFERLLDEWEHRSLSVQLTD